ncbi:MAG TPA: glycosyltransferase [Bryobacteraceae bacterium]|nr:glycosyltransferase [Bryobacteraceae bacterium]
MNLGLDQPATHGDRAPAKTGTPGSRPRVLQVGKFYPPHMGGIETHLQALCGSVKEEVDLRVIVSNDDRRTVEGVLDDVRVLRVGTLGMAFSTPVCPALVSRIRACPADIVHLHLPNPTAVLAYLASGHRGRLVITYHSDTVKQKVLGRLFEPFLHAALRRSSAIVATSPNYLRSSAVLEAYRDRCHIIPYGIDSSQFETCDPQAVERIRREYGERLVISVGRLVYYKGFEYIIRAMASIHAKLLIVGNGPLRGKLQNLATELGVANKVIFAGEIQNTEIAPYYHAARVFAFPSVARSEAFGIVQIEAMAAGLPVVNTSLDSGVPFVSLHGKTGLTVPPCDPTGLAQAINRLLDDDGLRSSFSEAGVRRARQEFGLESMRSRMLQLYETVLQARP